MGDITHLPPENGEILFLVTVLDCFGRRIVGWSIADPVLHRLVANTLTMAARTRGGLNGALFRSGHAARYESRAFACLCDQMEVTRSMGEVGTSAGNAACESFHAFLKRETLQSARDYGGADTCGAMVFARLSRCNPRRRHSTKATSPSTNTNDGTTPLSSRSPRDR
ncbi:DDE-type integrase/transposase/recombinase [Streptomyces tauricus]|uniref:DDE-type integrase/transposase/recombinase n=1 Tax=Streptomyces tauricus TaxID=68274 RepID=UPI0022447445|nr:DDE-type integrase/transposase/recombinase [Streptomyces tauricus]MCW8102727.1 DDE-type integrase/transposase/recombinase [Streptomyces tauricus]